MSSRGLQLEMSSLRAENARLAQEAAQAQSAMSALKGTLDTAQREAQQVCVLLPLALVCVAI